MSMILQRFDLIEDDPSYQLSVAETLTLKPRRLSHPRQAARQRLVQAAQRGRRRAPPSLPRHPSPAPRAPTRRRRRRCWCSTARTPARPRPSPSASRATPRRRAMRPSAAPLDDHAGRLPTDGAVVRRRPRRTKASRPTTRASSRPGSSRSPAGALKGVRYAVFGCGNRQWARTYQAVPKRFDAALEAAGATRLKPRGETDAGGDFFGAFDEWYGGAVGRPRPRARQGGAGRADRRAAAGRGRQGRPHRRSCASATSSTARSSRTASSSTWRSPLGRSKRHIDIALARGHELPRGRLPRRAAAQPDRRRDARAEALQSRRRQPDRHHASRRAASLRCRSAIR